MPEHRPTTSPDGDDEELVTGLRRPRATALFRVRHRRWALLAVVVLAVGTVVVVVLARGTSPARRAGAPTATRSAASTPAGRAVSLAARCPAGATCATTSDLPVTAASALRGAFPSAVITETVSLQANRTGHFEPDLVARRLDALVGNGTTLTLRVDAAPPGVLPSGSRVVQAGATATGARAVGRVDGFVVTATVAGRSPGTATLPALRRLVVAGALTDAQ